MSEINSIFVGFFYFVNCKYLLIVGDRDISRPYQMDVVDDGCKYWRDVALF